MMYNMHFVNYRIIKLIIKKDVEFRKKWYIDNDILYPIYKLDEDGNKTKEVIDNDVEEKCCQLNKKLNILKNISLYTIIYNATR